MDLNISRSQNGDFYFHVFQAQPASALMEPHKHSFLQLFYIMSGSFRHIVNGKAHIQSKNELLILPPYMIHQIDTRESSDVEWLIINIGNGFLNCTSSEHTQGVLFDLVCLRPLIYHASNVSPFLQFNDEERQRLSQILCKLQNEHDTSNCTLSFVRAAVSQLFSIITARYISATNAKEDYVITTYRKSLQIAMEYIDEHYTEAITREEICRIAHMSKSSFTYIFRQLTGVTFMEYIHNNRIHLAKQLLEERKKNLTQIGDLCGFSSLTYFSRVFKKCTGLSPREYVKSLGEGANDVDT